MITKNYYNIIKQVNSKAKTIVVSKGIDCDSIAKIIACNHIDFAENRVEEAIKKWQNLRSSDIKLHFIGNIQSSKVNDIVNCFDFVHSLDRVKIIELMAISQKKLGKQLDYFIQVNLAEEEGKNGIAPDKLAETLAIARQHNLNVIGLMCLPPINQDSKLGLYFAFLRELARRHELKELSMGMSNDYLTALDFGSTYVRIGRAIFADTVSVFG